MPPFSTPETTNSSNDNQQPRGTSSSVSPRDQSGVLPRFLHLFLGPFFPQRRTAVFPLSRFWDLSTHIRIIVEDFTELALALTPGPPFVWIYTCFLIFLIYCSAVLHPPLFWATFLPPPSPPSPPPPSLLRLLLFVLEGRFFGGLAFCDCGVSRFILLRFAYSAVVCATVPSGLRACADFCHPTLAGAVSSLLDVRESAHLLDVWKSMEETGRATTLKLPFLRGMRASSGEWKRSRFMYLD